MFPWQQGFLGMGATGWNETVRTGDGLGEKWGKIFYLYLFFHLNQPKGREIWGGNKTNPHNFRNLQNLHTAPN